MAVASSAVTGFEKRKPWKASQWFARRKSSCWRVSTPSAMQRSFRRFAIAMIASVMDPLCWSSTTFMMNERSIFMLEVDQARVGAGLAHDLQQCRHEPARHELPRRDVDRDGDRGQPLVLPVAQLPAGGAEDPLANRHDEPQILGDEDEVLREDLALLRIVPADER